VTPGQAAYDAYAGHTGGRSLISGAELPRWDRLPAAIKDAWEAAAAAVSRAFRCSDCAGG
jgi:hypothetical protein